MTLGAVDLLVLAGYFAMTLVVGLYFARRARRSMLDYFLSARSMPWWVAGTAMVATTFSADTPLAVTEMVAKNGIAGNWLWWSMLASGMLTVFFFAKLWRRAAVVTDVELAELRYSGRPAAFLRGFRAAYLGLLVNILIMGWVNLGMAKVLGGMLGVSKWAALVICLVLTALYTVLAGYWGVASANGLQYLFEMGGAIVLAFVSVAAVGGIAAMKARVGAAHPAFSPEGTRFGSAEAILAIWPLGIEGVWILPVITFATLLGVSWWASWYPGAEPGGGGYVAQNMLACKDEGNARAAALYFNVAHYAIRSWPWVVTALCSLAIFGGSVRNAAGAEDPGLNYVRMMVDYLPPGLRGFMLASFAAAYMSTQATQMNWGSSYLINDLYRRFLRKGASERTYVFASRVATALTVVLSLVATVFMNQISKVWELLLTLGAGTGLVYILRWYWWRVNAWSEVAAMSSALVTSVSLRSLGSHYAAFDPATPRGFAMTLVTTTVVTTAVWLSTTFATRPEPREKLLAFYEKVRPAGPGWKRIAGSEGVAARRGEIPRNLAFWGLGTVFVYSIMFATGAVIFGQHSRAIFFGALLAISGGLLFSGLVREKT
ncbi:MAG: sodium:proline symporter [Acidobacteria bacterium]|nr:MAG: sodium:proline symporter [Acidobacteriota bacterium]PYQ64500.1 MAG: sodium:proline symporter [Acidobacteriota bacterium]